MTGPDGIFLPVILCSSAQIIVKINFCGLIDMDGIHVDEAGAARTEVLELDITGDLIEVRRMLRRIFSLAQTAVVY